jgi:hypothetical protein
VLAAALQVVLTQGRLLRVAVTATKYQLEEQAAAAAAAAAAGSTGSSSTTTSSSSSSPRPGGGAAAAGQPALHQSVTNAFSFLFLAAAPAHLVPQVVPHSLEEVGEYLEAVRAQRAAAERPSGGNAVAVDSTAQDSGQGVNAPASRL